MKDLQQFESFETVSSAQTNRKATEGVDATALMNKVYLWMTLGLAITGFVAMYIASDPVLLAGVAGGPMLILAILQIGAVVWLSTRIMHMQAITATLVFLAYSGLTGIWMAPLFMVYTDTSIATTFLITAGTFGLMATYGMTTNQDLSKFGNILFMGLIGIIIASVANWFIGSGPLQFLIAIIGVLVFTGLTAYDAQRIKNMSYELQYSGEELQTKMSILGALSLYLNFINLFIMLLQLFGGRRE